MKNRKYIIFEVKEYFKKKIAEMALNYKANGVSCPLKSSAFCRVAIEKYIKELEDKGEWSK